MRLSAPRALSGGRRNHRVDPFRIIKIGIVLLSTIGCWSEGENGDDMYPKSFYCPPLNCSDRLTIYTEYKDKSDFETGVYRFEVTTPTEPLQEIVCTVTPDSSTCDGDSDALYITLDKAEKRFVLRFDATPAQVFVTLYFDDDLLIESSLYPDYERITATDPACEEFCLQGTAYIQVEP